jgi:hypothetical protein
VRPRARATALVGGALAALASPALGAAPSSSPSPSLPGIPAPDARAIAGYRAWQPLARPPAAGLRPLGAAHLGRTHRVYVDRTRAQLSRGGRQRYPYPRGAVVVKEGLDAGDLDLIAVMRKVAGGSGVASWTYAEYTRAGGRGPFRRVSAPTSVCTGCHLNATSRQHTDWVFWSLT